MPSKIAAQMPAGASFHELPREARMDHAVVLHLWKRMSGDPSERPPSWTELDDEALDDSFAELCTDRDFMLKALKLFPYVDWGDVPDELWTDPEVVLQCLKIDVKHHNYGFKLADVPGELFADRDFALKAVALRGDALSFFPEELRADREFVLEALRRGGCLGCVPENMRADPELALAAVRANTDNFTYVPLELRPDRQMVLTFVKHLNSEGALTLDALPEEAFMDLETVLEALRTHGPGALECVPAAFMGDRENVVQVMRAAEAGRTPGTSDHADVLPYVPEELLMDRAFLMGALMEVSVP